MEIFVLLLIVFGPVVWRLISESGGTSYGAHNTYTVPSVPRLECRMKIGSMDIDDEVFSTLMFEVKGEIPGGSGIGIFAHLRTRDGLVRSYSPECQEADSLSFQFTSDQVVHNPQAENYWPDWVGVGGAALPLLISAKGGLQDCRLQLSFLQCHYGGSEGWAAPAFRNGAPSGSEVPLRVIESPWVSVKFDEVGYLELDSMRAKWSEATVKLAFCMAASDGGIGEAEVTAVRTWSDRTIESVDDDTGELRERLNRAVTTGLQTGYQVNLDPVYRALHEAPKGIRLEAVELITEVLAADGVASHGELAMRDQAVERLGLDVQECRAMLDKKIVSSELEFGVDSSPFVALGIAEDLSHGEVQSALNAEFRKWNGRTTHPDPEIRSKAEEMLDLVAEAKQLVEAG